MIWKQAAVAYQDTAPPFAWKDWGKPRRNLLRIAGVPAEIRTQHLRNASLERYRCLLPVRVRQIIIPFNFIYIFYVT
jgi:hypothetical protein